MNVNLHIKEITFHGIPVTRADLPVVERAICDRLVSQLRSAEGEEDLADALVFGGRVDIGQNIDPVEFGNDLAGSLYSLRDQSAGGTN